MLLQTVFTGRVPTGRAGLAVVAGVRLVVGVVGVSVALDGVGTGTVVITSGEVAEIMVGDGLTGDDLLMNQSTVGTVTVAVAMGTLRRGRGGVVVVVCRHELTVVGGTAVLDVERGVGEGRGA